VTILATFCYLAVGLLFLVWVGYPLAIGAASVVVGSPARAKTTRDYQPTVTAILVTREAGDVVADRVRNLLETGYPSDRVNVVVAFDAASGPVEGAAIEALDSRVRCIQGDEPGGKAAGLNAAVRVATGEILVMADAAQRFDAQTIPALVSALADERFGAVSGALTLADGGPATWPIQLYWRWEKWLRHREAVLSSSVGVTGAVYAIRRALWPIVPSGVLLDDVFVPMTVALGGSRVGFTYEAVAIERRVFGAGAEANRKARTLTGVLQLAQVIPNLFSPSKNPLFVQLVMHKYARLATPALVSIAAVSGGILLSVSLRKFGPTTLIVLAALAAICVVVGPVRRLTMSSIRWAVAMQVATARAITNAARNRWDVWNR
jgi:hypothetical protein